jgi:hypothetical protein
MRKTHNRLVLPAVILLLAAALLPAGCGRREGGAAAKAPAGRSAQTAAAVSNAAAIDIAEGWEAPVPPLPDRAEAETNTVARVRLELRENAVRMANVTRERSKLELKARADNPELQKLYDELQALRARYDARLAEQAIVKAMDVNLAGLRRRQEALLALLQKQIDLTKSVPTKENEP